MLTLPMSKGHLRSFSVSADSPPIVSGLSPEVVAESKRIFSDFLTEIKKSNQLTAVNIKQIVYLKFLIKPTVSKCQHILKTIINLFSYSLKKLKNSTTSVNIVYESQSVSKCLFFHRVF
jgi:hypothetical protein